MLFNFQLNPIDAIAPWGLEPHLHWYGITFGNYWIDIGGVELFRYTDAMLNQWQLSTEQPYDDYQVSRIWEDVLKFLPDVLASVPESVARTLGVSGDGQSWEARVTRWRARRVSEDDEYDNLYDQATWWWHSRRMTSGYLIYDPCIFLWRIGTEITMRWNTDLRTPDGLPVWTAAPGTCTLPVPDFIDEVRSFDDRLMRSMGERVRSVKERWDRSGISIDVDNLEREQRDRSQWLAQSLQRAPGLPATDWEQVVHAATRLGL